MIIVLLLVFQSICRLCQRIVLHIYDRWINPKNVRLLSETELKITLVKRRHRRDTHQRPTSITRLYTKNFEKGSKPKHTPRQRYSNSGLNTNLANITVDSPYNSIGRSAVLDTECRFCANTPQGYCRHHLHLQELQVQKQQQQRLWNPLTVRPNIAQEYRELRKINRELRQTLKNRFSTHQIQKQAQQFHNINNSNNNNTSSAKSLEKGANISNYCTSEDSGYCSLSNSNSPISCHISPNGIQETTCFFGSLIETTNNSKR